MDNKTICTRFEELVSERKGSVESIWDLIERFVVPLRGDFYVTLDSEHEVDWHRREIYDQTAVFAAQSLAAGLHGNLTSPTQRWFDLKFRDDDLNSNDAAKEWLEEATERVFQALNEANFDTEMAEAYLDLVAYGTTAITEEVDDDGTLVFSAIPVRGIFFEENHKGEIHRLYRRYEWTPLQMVTKFGEEGVPERIRKLADEGNAVTQRMDVVFCIFPRDTEVDVSKPVAPKSRPFGYKYVLKDGQELLGEEDGYYEMPAFVTRWRKAAGSRWGFSPAVTSMATILTLNQTIEVTLEAAGKAIDPANMAEQGVLLGNLDLDRGSLNIVTDVNGVRPYESGTRFDVSNLVIERMQDEIRQAFLQDQLALKESPQMTATEVNVRWEMMQRLLGPTLGRLKNDLLDPLVERSFNILFRAGQLPELPEGLSGEDMDIEYNGPLPRAQQSNTAGAIEQMIVSVSQLAEIFPQAIDLIEIDEAVREIARLRGVPAKAMRSDEDVERKRKQDQQRQEAMMQVQAAQGAGEAMKSIGEGGQALQAIQGGQSEPPIPGAA